MSAHRVLFRADASHAGGFGHVARSCALIEELRDRGAAPIAMFGGDPAVVGPWCEAHRIAARIGTWSPRQLVEVAVAERVDSIVLDGPALVDELAPELAARGLRTVILDDKGAVAHPVAAIVNHNLHAEALAATYPHASRRLLGRRYLMLREEIRRYPRGACRPMNPARLRVVITYGGSDPVDATSRTLRFLPGDRPLDLVVIAGPSYRHDDALGAALDDARGRGHAVELHRSPGDPGRLFTRADAAICSAGGTLGELAYLGCPAAGYAIAPDQIEPARHQADAGLIAGGRAWTEIPDERLRDDLAGFLLDDGGRAALRQRALATADADGAKRIVDEALRGV